MENSFLELRCKDVINVCDGKKLGHIIDIVFELPSGKIKGLVVPIKQRGFNLFGSSKQAFIPFGQILKIGVDTILVGAISDNKSDNNSYVLNAPNNNK